MTRGFYRHYKGPLYWVESVGVLHDTTRRVVVYHSSQSALEPVGVRLRYEDQFEQFVYSSDGEAYKGPVPAKRDGSDGGFTTLRDNRLERIVPRFLRREFAT